METATNSSDRKRKSVTLDEIEDMAEQIRASDMSPLEKQRQMVLIYSRRKRAKKRLTMELLVQQKKDFQMQLGELRTENQRLQKLLTAGVVESTAQQHMMTLTSTQTCLPTMVPNAAPAHSLQVLQALAMDSLLRTQVRPLTQFMPHQELLFSVSEIPQPVGLPALLSRAAPAPPRSPLSPSRRPLDDDSSGATTRSSTRFAIPQDMGMIDNPPRKPIDALAHAFTLEAVMLAKQRSDSPGSFSLASMGGGDWMREPHPSEMRTAVPTPRTFSAVIQALQGVRSPRSW